MEELGYDDDIDTKFITSVFVGALIIPILFFFLYITLARANII
jgi:hypothetical protein